MNKVRTHEPDDPRAIFEGCPGIASAKLEDGVLTLLSSKIEGHGAVRYQYTEHHQLQDVGDLNRLGDGFAGRERARAEYVESGHRAKGARYERITPLEQPMSSWVDQRKERIFFPERYREVSS